VVPAGIADGQDGVGTRWTHPGAGIGRTMGNGPTTPPPVAGSASCRISSAYAVLPPYIARALRSSRRCPSSLPSSNLATYDAATVIASSGR
jgi:hypothetical protein